MWGKCFSLYFSSHGSVCFSQKFINGSMTQAWPIEHSITLALVIGSQMVFDLGQDNET